MIIKKTRKSKKSKKNKKTRSKKQKGGNQEEKDNYLFDAIIIDDSDKVVRALKNGADVNAKTADGWTPLYSAVHEENKEIVEILLENGADVNVKGSYGWTALMKASFDGHTEIVTMLLDKGADVNAKNIHDWTALDWANKNEHTSVVVLLEKAKKVRDNKQKAMGLIKDRHENPASLVTQIHRGMDTNATIDYNKAVREGTIPAPGSGSNSKLGGKRKTRKSKKSKKSKKTRSNKKEFLYNPNDPSKSFDVYIDKNPSDTIPIKYTTVKDVRDTISKLERLYKNKKYPHKRIWQVGMIMKVRLEAMKKHKKTRYPNAKNVTARYNLTNKYFKKLGKRSKELAKKRRTRKKQTGGVTLYDVGIN